MIQPVAVGNLHIAFLAAAGVVLGGVSFAGLFAWGKLRGSRRLLWASYLAYVVTAAAILLLAFVLHLDGYWRALVAMMLTGYFGAPHAVWHLSRLTHGTAQRHRLSQKNCRLPFVQEEDHE